MKKYAGLLILFVIPLVTAAYAGWSLWRTPPPSADWKTCAVPVQVAASDGVIQPISEEPVTLEVSVPSALAIIRPGKEVGANEELSGTITLQEGAIVQLTDGQLALHRGNMAYLVSDEAQLVTREDFEIALDGSLKADASGKVPAGTELTAKLSKRLKVRLQEATNLRPYPAAITEGRTASSVRSLYFPNATPRNTLTVRLNKPGVDFLAAKAGLQVCVRTNQDANPQNVAIEKIEAVNGSSNDQVALTVALPASLRPYLWDRGAVAVMVADGTFAGQDVFYLTGAFAAFSFALASVFLLGVVIKHQIAKGADWRVWLSDQHTPSLSRFQILLWTWVVLGGSLYVFALTTELLSLTPEVLGLLGIAGLGSVSARLVAVSQGTLPAAKATDQPLATMFQTDGNFDIFKLQMFIFTSFTALFVVGRVLIDRAFPPLDANLLLLMGISNGIYVSSKVAVGETPLRIVERLDVELKVLNEAKANVEGDIKRLDHELKTVSDESDRKLLEKRKEPLTAKVADYEKKIAEATAARKKAIERLLPS